MNAPAIVRAKAALHSHPMAYWQNVAKELLKAETASEMEQALHFGYPVTAKDTAKRL